MSVSAKEFDPNIATVVATMKQELFNNVQANLVNPIMSLVIGTELGDLNNTLDLGFLSEEFNLTKIMLTNFNESSKEAMIQLHDDYITLSIPNFNFNMTSSEYFVISDPPVFADLGAFYLTVDNTTIDLKSKPYMKDYGLQVGIDSMALEGDGLNFDFDGLSDFSIWISETLNMFTNVIFGRLVSLVKYSLHESIEPIFNNILAFIPRDIPIDDDLDFHLGLSHDPAFDKNFLSMPFAFELTSKKFPTPFAQPDVLPLVVDNDYQFTLSISQYMVDAAFYLIHKEGLLQVDINSTSNSTVVTVDDLSYAMPEIEFYYSAKQPCNIRIQTADAPHINLTQNEQQFISLIDMKFDCFDETLGQFTEAAIVQATLNSTFNMSLLDNLTISVKVNQLNFDFTKVVHSNVGDIIIGVIDTLIDTVTPAIAFSINALLEKGIAIYPLIKPYTDMLYLDLSKIEMVNEDGFLQVLVTPIFEVGSKQDVQKQFKAFMDSKLGNGFHIDSIEQALEKELFGLKVSQLIGLAAKKQELAFLMMPFIRQSTLLHDLISRQE